MEDLLIVVSEYLYTKTLLAFRTSCKHNNMNVKINEILLNKYIQRIKGQSFLNKKYLLKPVFYPYRLVRQTNCSPREQICKYNPYHMFDSKRRGPEELYKTDYKKFT